MQRKKTHNNFQVLIVINAILYLFSIPSDMPVIYENGLAIASFLLTLFLSIKLFRVNIVGLSMYFFIIALYYNPFLFLMHNMRTPSGLDALTGITFFIIALCWSYIAEDNRKL